MRFALFLCFSAALAQPPETTISNGKVLARLYLPDPANGYYRGTRFDWSGVMSSLKTANHEYFGQWFERYHPQLHDAIQGPVEEYGPVGYDQAKPRELFLRIGVGTVRKPEGEREYQRFKTYEIANGGRWIIRPGRDRVEFVHELRDLSSGYGYQYEKTVRLDGKKPILYLEHKLKNTGTHPIATTQYNHNFFMLDNQPTGPDFSVRFAEPINVTKPFANDAGFVEGAYIRYRRELNTGESVFGEFAGMQRYDIRVENVKTKAAVDISSELPISKIIYWSIRTTLCPEAYVELNIPAGKQVKWTYVYRFAE